MPSTVPPIGPSRPTSLTGPSTALWLLPTLRALPQSCLFLVLAGIWVLVGVQVLFVAAGELLL